jgi:hypothetical protein
MVFSTDCVSGVKNFKYVCSGLTCCVCGLISVSSWFFLWFFICGFCSGFIFEPCSSILVFQ